MPKRALDFGRRFNWLHPEGCFNTNRRRVYVSLICSGLWKREIGRTACMGNGRWRKNCEQCFVRKGHRGNHREGPSALTQWPQVSSALQRDARKKSGHPPVRDSIFHLSSRDISRWIQATEVTSEDAFRWYLLHDTDRRIDGKCSFYMCNLGEITHPGRKIY